MTYLSKDEHARFKEICDREDCTPYMLIKKAVLDHIWAYPLENASYAEKEEIKPDLGENAITDAPESEPSVEPEAVSDRVKKILEGKEE